MTLNLFCRNVGIKQMIVGGVNDDWSVPEMEAPAEEEDLNIRQEQS